MKYAELNIKEKTNAAWKCNYLSSISLWVWWYNQKRWKH